MSDVLPLPTSVTIGIFGMLAVLAVVIILLIVANQGKSKLITEYDSLVNEVHSTNKRIVTSMNKEIEYLNEEKPEWGLHLIENKIRDISYYKKTHTEIEEIVDLSYMHNKAFDDIFNDVEVSIVIYERVIESFFMKYRKHRETVDESFILSRILYDNKKSGYLDKIYEVIVGDKHNKDFL